MRKHDYKGGNEWKDICAMKDTMGKVNRQMMSGKDICNISVQQRVIQGSHTRECWRSRDFPGGAVVKKQPANAGDTCLSPGPERSHMPQSN